MTLSIDSHCLPISAQTGSQRIFTLSRRSLRRSSSAGWRGCWGNVRRKKNWRSGSRGFDWWVHPDRHVTAVFSAIVVFCFPLYQTLMSLPLLFMSETVGCVLLSMGLCSFLSSFCSVSGQSPAEIELLASLLQCNDFVWSQSGREEMLAHTANGNLFPDSKPGVKSQGRLFM